MSEETSQITTLNRMYNQYNPLQVRLDTSELLNQSKMYLHAEIENFSQDATGKVARDTIKIGSPKANKKGIAAILNWMQMIINPQVVQGNFPMDNKGSSTMYNNYIYECQCNLMDMLMINLYDYGIEEEEVQGIVDAMMNLIQPFMTRLIGNKERESYGDTFKEITGTSSNKKMPFLK